MTAQDLAGGKQSSSSRSKRPRRPEASEHLYTPMSTENENFRSLPAQLNQYPNTVSIYCKSFLNLQPILLKLIQITQILLKFYSILLNFAQFYSFLNLFLELCATKKSEESSQ